MYCACNFVYQIMKYLNQYYLCMFKLYVHLLDFEGKLFEKIRKYYLDPR